MIVAFLTQSGIARDFNYTYEGQTLRYTVIDETAKTCEVARHNNVAGDLIIPSVAKDRDSEYAVTSIGYYAFERCTSLTSVTIPNSVTSIDDNAFDSSSGLTSVTIGNSLTSVSAFSVCPNITEYIINAENKSLSSIDGVVFNKDATKIIRYPQGRIGGYDIPNKVTSICDSTFCGCSGLTSVTIPNSVTSIGDFAFDSCTGLTPVIIPNSVTSIGSYAFFSCTGFTSVTIPNSVTSIGQGAFSFCSGLTSVTIPNSVTSIGYGAFTFCSGLTSVTIPNSITSIVEDIFYMCTGLTSVTIPDSVTSIGKSAFSCCESLTKVTIGKSVNNIGSDAFWKCEKITDVICMAEKVPSLYEDAFEKSVYDNASLHVLKGLINDYKTTNPWSLFFNIVGDAEVTTGIEGVESDEMTVGQPAEYYNLQGVRVAEPKKGALYLRKQGNRTEKIIMR